MRFIKKKLSARLIYQSMEIFYSIYVFIFLKDLICLIVVEIIFGMCFGLVSSQDDYEIKNKKPNRL